MSRSRISALWVVMLAVVLTLVVAIAPNAHATGEEIPDTSEGGTQKPTTDTQPTEPEDDDTVIDIPITEPEEPAIQQGLVVENGNTYFYNEDGTLFTEGYKQVTVDGEDYYYFFQED
ncbi:MAG: hypothetical protein IKW10_07300, partial [Oscillospiraceae bacterium]|nr:hypothetical protein [Oscillospiraceae bacterium]